MRVIGLHGRKRVGKDTVAEILCRRLKFVQLAFADPLYEMLSHLCVDQRYIEDKLEPIPWLGKSYTDLLQSLGTGWGRDMVRQDIWIRALNERVVRLQEQGCPGVVISDVRYEDEARYVRQIVSGVVIEVVGPRGVVYNDHASEAPLPRMLLSGTILNDADLFTLEDRVMRVMDAIL